MAVRTEPLGVGIAGIGCALPSTSRRSTTTPRRGPDACGRMRAGCARARAGRSRRLLLESTRSAISSSLRISTSSRSRRRIICTPLRQSPPAWRKHILLEAHGVERRRMATFTRLSPRPASHDRVLRAALQPLHPLRRQLRESAVSARFISPACSTVAPDWYRLGVVPHAQGGGSHRSPRLCRRRDSVAERSGARSRLPRAHHTGAVADDDRREPAAVGRCARPRDQPTDFQPYPVRRRADGASRQRSRHALRGTTNRWISTSCAAPTRSRRSSCSTRSTAAEARRCGSTA